MEWLKGLGSSKMNFLTPSKIYRPRCFLGQMWATGTQRQYSRSMPCTRQTIKHNIRAEWKFNRLTSKHLWAYVAWGDFLVCVLHKVVTFHVARRSHIFSRSTFPTHTKSDCWKFVEIDRFENEKTPTHSSIETRWKASLNYLVWAVVSLWLKNRINKERFQIIYFIMESFGF